MPLVVPADKTAEVTSLLDEFYAISRKILDTPIERINLDEFLALEARHHEIRGEVESLCQRED